MLKTNSGKIFARDLTRWYQKHQRSLPWRDSRDPYHIWASEIMLQQTTVNAVIPYYERWLKTFPTVFDLARADIHDVLKAWQGLGYYARAKNFHKAAGLVVDDHEGKLPADPVVVRSLPGFGPYTTGSVLSIAYDARLPIIDANVRRVVMRLLALPGEADTQQDKKVTAFLEKVLPRKGVGDFNQALMELGALVCRSKEPLCLLCPVRPYCSAYTKGKQEIIPKPKQKIIKDIETVIAVIRHKGKFFIQKRPSKGLLADLWEFPGGKVEKGESTRKALDREMQEELGVEIVNAQHLFDVQHFYTTFRVKLSVWSVETASLPKTDKTHRWVSSRDFVQYPMPSGTVKVIEKLMSKNS